jgi:hypothetical protein
MLRSACNRRNEKSVAPVPVQTPDAHVYGNAAAVAGRSAVCTEKNVIGTGAGAGSVDVVFTVVLGENVAASITRSERLSYADE